MEEDRPPFDTVTRYDGSLNATIAARDRVKAFLEKKAEVEGQKLRNLPTIEQDCQVLIQGETIVNLKQDMIDSLRRVYQQSKLRGEEDLPDTETEEFFYAICGDPYLEKKLGTIVRETTDEEREVLDNFLVKVEREHGQKRIHWDQFMTYFTRRGKLRQDEEIFFSGLGIEEIDTARLESQRYLPEDADT